SACGGTVQPSATTATASVAPAPAATAETSAAPVMSDSGYLSGLDATTFTTEAQARGLSCDEYSSQEQPDQQVWSCTGHATDGSELLMSAHGPDRGRLAFATAEVLGNGPVKDEIVIDFLGPMGRLYAGADGAQAQVWLVGALAKAQRDGHIETDVGGDHLRLTFEDHGPGTPSATYLLVESSGGPPAQPTPGALPSGPGAGFL